jgi:hypothetical protein
MHALLQHEGKFAGGIAICRIGFSSHTNHWQGKSVVVLGGSISGRTGITRDSIPGQEIQLKAVRITQTYTREYAAVEAGQSGSYYRSHIN